MSEAFRPSEESEKSSIRRCEKSERSAFSHLAGKKNFYFFVWKNEGFFEWFVLILQMLSRGDGSEALKVLTTMNCSLNRVCGSGCRKFFCLYVLYKCIMVLDNIVHVGKFWATRLATRLGRAKKVPSGSGWNQMIWWISNVDDVRGLNIEVRGPRPGSRVRACTGPCD